MEILKIFACCAAFVLINCAPASHNFEHFAEYGRSAAPDTFFDIDSEQLQARYDPRQLRENIGGYLSPATSSSSSNEDATSCQTANERFVHGQKVPRADPCEICLCVDGEIFCWWKICNRRLLKKYPKAIKHHSHHRQPNNHHQPPPIASLVHKKNTNKRKKNRDSSWMKSRDAALDGIPANVLNFPQHLPTHFLHDVQEVQQHKKHQHDEEEWVGNDEQGNISVDALNKHKEIETEIESETPPPMRHTTNDQRRSEARDSTMPTSSRTTTTTTTTTTIKPITDIRSDSVIADGGVFVVSKTDIPANVLSANGNVDDDVDDVDKRPNRIDANSNDGDTSNPKSANLAQPSLVVPFSSASPAATVSSPTHPHHPTGDKLRIITVNPIVIDNRTGSQGIYRSNTTATTHEGGVVVAGGPTNERRSEADGGSRNVERGYYEKTIFNKNGVFIENIRKIANINDEDEGLGMQGESTHKVILNAGSSNSAATLHGGSSDEDNDSDDSVEAEAAAASMKKIALMSVPLSQHYVITSSGRIEKSDTLASDDVIAQFRDGLNEYPRPAYRTSDGGGGDDGAAQSQADDMLHNGDSSVTFLAAAATQPSTTETAMTTVTAAASASMVMPSKALPLPCIVMGTSYAIGTVLPQESGNCLQCVCTDESPDDPSPRVTCSSHNCPPLILPDLFDATGY